MPTLLVDTSVLIDLAKPDSEWHERSATTLERLDPSSAFVINPVIYAECSVGFATIEAIERFLGVLGFGWRELPREALFLAARAFVAYRRRGGPRTNVLPDFFIGAHAAVASLPLLTRDPARVAAYFPTVPIVRPG